MWTCLLALINLHFGKGKKGPMMLKQRPNTDYTFCSFINLLEWGLMISISIYQQGSTSKAFKDTSTRRRCGPWRRGVLFILYWCCLRRRRREGLRILYWMACCFLDQKAIDVVFGCIYIKDCLLHFGSDLSIFPKNMFLIQIIRYKNGQYLFINFWLTTLRPPFIDSPVLIDVWSPFLSGRPIISTFVVSISLWAWPYHSWLCLWVKQSKGDISSGWRYRHQIILLFSSLSLEIARLFFSLVVQIRDP